MEQARVGFGRAGVARRAPELEHGPDEGRGELVERRKDARARRRTLGVVELLQRKKLPARLVHVTFPGAGGANVRKEFNDALDLAR